ncbi:hypothetical protein Scep_007981 [Stephania cephalantha]|uniref:G protein gamma domain-containing protein n=1 Tax=Stephania cephalantha TaxID=152367 RepID=A0AAP0KCT4_9MAGN
MAALTSSSSSSDSSSAITSTTTITTTNCSSSSSLPFPLPKSPPKYPDMSGKRRELAKIQILEREIGFLEEELKSFEGVQLASRSCKEVHEFVGTRSDPLIPTNRKSSRSSRFWKQLCKRSCLNLSWICCFSGCTCKLKPWNCCPACCKSENWLCFLDAPCCFCNCRPRCDCLKNTPCRRCCVCKAPSCPDCPNCCRCSCSCPDCTKVCSSCSYSCSCPCSKCIKRCCCNSCLFC